MGLNFVAMALGEVWTEETRYILGTTKIKPKVKSDIVKWLIGNICTHTICRKCGQEVSRNHGIQCAGVEMWVMRIFPNAYEQWEGRKEERKRESVLDIILRTNKHTEDGGFYELISTFIGKIQAECHGFQRIDLVNLGSLTELQNWKERMQTFDLISIPIQENNTQLQEEMEQLLAEIDTTRQSCDVNTANSNNTNKRKQQNKSKSKPKKRPKTDFFKKRTKDAETSPNQKNMAEVDENQVWDPPE
jgi:hypothetical protein